MQKPFTLHIRLTKSCNANCTYCSSFQNNPDKFMSLDDFKLSIGAFWKKTKDLGVEISFLTIEYVGGEILLVPQDIFYEQVTYARNFFLSHGVQLKDGVQTNLIASREKVVWLSKLFPGRMGTSIDNSTDQRRIGDSHKRYRVIMLSREKAALGDSKKFPGVLTVDKKMLPHVVSELSMASRQRRNLTLRPAFVGGKSDVNHVSPSEFGHVMVNSFESWFMRMPIIVEPHYSRFRKRFNKHYGINLDQDYSYCAFQSDCAVKSMSIEPNGDVYICQELADKGYGLLGNLLNGEWNDSAWGSILARSENLSMDCLECPYLSECRGGCMMQSVEAGAGIYGKPAYCESWKMMFSAYDSAILSTDKAMVIRWLDRIGQISKEF